MLRNFFAYLILLFSLATSLNAQHSAKRSSTTGSPRISSRSISTKSLSPRQSPAARSRLTAGTSLTFPQGQSSPKLPAIKGCWTIKQPLHHRRGLHKLEPLNRQSVTPPASTFSSSPEYLSIKLAFPITPAPSPEDLTPEARDQYLASWKKNPANESNWLLTALANEIEIAINNSEQVDDVDGRSFIDYYYSDQALALVKLWLAHFSSTQMVGPEYICDSLNRLHQECLASLGNIHGTAETLADVHEIFWNVYFTSHSQITPEGWQDHRRISDQTRKNLTQWLFEHFLMNQPLILWLSGKGPKPS